jgi:hypothetical protein
VAHGRIIDFSAAEEGLLHDASQHLTRIRGDFVAMMKR